MTTSTYTPKHRRVDLGHAYPYSRALDAANESRATCLLHASACPRHDAHTYAQTLAKHRAS